MSTLLKPNPLQSPDYLSTVSPAQTQATSVNLPNPAGGPLKMPKEDVTRIPSYAMKTPNLMVPLIRNPDGTFTRVPNPHGSIPATPDLTTPVPVLSKDVPLNPLHKTWLRIFLPRQAFLLKRTRMPLIVYFTGSGFIEPGVDAPSYHNICVDMALRVNAVVVSVEHRMGPEDRLPAAYEDGMETLQWIRSTPDEWVSNFADLSMCFLMGNSAGGNISYHIGLEAAVLGDDLLPVKIQGLILHQPGFNGNKKTPSEMRLINHPNPKLPKEFPDIYFRLALPIGSDFDHPYSNPMETAEFESLKKLASIRCKVLVMGSTADVLIDRQIEFLKMLEDKGVNVVARIYEGGRHGLRRMTVAEYWVLLDDVTNFVASVRNKMPYSSRL